MKTRIYRRINKAIQEKVFPGCVVGVIKRGGGRKIWPFGLFTYDEDSSVVNEDTVYDTASITKSIPTASLLLTLADGGTVSLDDSVVKYVPEFGNQKEKESVLIRHLLTYTLDLVVPSMSSLKTKSADEIIKTIIEAPLRHPLGTTHLYTNSTALVMGLLIRNASRKNIDDFADEEFFKPLGMNRSTFHPEMLPKSEIVPTEFDEWRDGLVWGEVHDEGSYVLNKKFILGISGLFSTVPDLLNFLEMILKNGELGGKKYFSPQIIETLSTNQLASIGESHGLGWQLNQPRFMGKYSATIFGKTGFTGCLILCDITKGIGMAMLSNTIYPKRKPNTDAINALRRDIADIVFG